MGGLAVLILVVGYIWIAHALVRRVNPIKYKALLTVVLLLIPTADAVYGRIKLKVMCVESGGLKVYKSVEDVEGFFDQFSPTPEWITKYGYQFVEGRDLGGRTKRISKGKDGKVREEWDATPKSVFRYESSSKQMGSGFSVEEKLVRDMRTNEILARSTNHGYEGGWAERFLAKFTGAGSAFAAACQEGAAQISPYRIVNSTLKPLK